MSLTTIVLSQINNSKISRESSGIWKINKFLNNSWIKEEITREVKKYLAMKWQLDIAFENLWHTY